MPPIDPQLLDRLTTKLGVTRARVYARIQEIANARMLDRNSAALVLAAENNIGIQRYAQPDELASIRGAIGGRKGSAESIPVAPVRNYRPMPSKGSKRRLKVRDNSVFVVHGRDEGLRKSMFDFLRALSLNPLEWSKAVLQTHKGGANPYVGDVIDSAMDRVQAVLRDFLP